jgi:hypothetical protein
MPDPTMTTPTPPAAQDTRQLEAAKLALEALRIAAIDKVNGWRSLGGMAADKQQEMAYPAMQMEAIASDAMQPRCLAHALARLSPAAATAASDEQMDADLEAAGIDMRPAYEQLRQMIEKAKMNALVDRFLQWPLPKSVRPEPGPFGPHDTGTCLLTADEAEQMLRYVLDVPAAEPRPAVERPAWAPADATHIHEEGDEVYRYNPESPRGYDYRTEKSPEWHKGYTRDRMTSDATLPLAPVAPAPPLAETGHDFTNSRGADLCDLCGQRRHAHAYPTLSAPAEPPPAPPATAGEGKTRGEQVYYKLKIDNAYSLPTHQVTIDALNVELKTEYERGYAAAQAEEGESRE